MKRRLVLRLEAEIDIVEAVNFYSVQSAAVKQNFIAALDEALNSILFSPRLYAVRYKSIRRINLPNFAYALWFEIIEGKDESTDEDVEFIVVLRCYHQRRDVTPRSFE